MTERSSVINLWSAERLSGRRKIYSSYKEVDKDNVVEILSNALTVHRANCSEIEYLHRFYRGIQDIRFKEKTVRPEINNKITVNIANEIVTFKTAFFIGTPMQYVSAGGDDKVSESVRKLNEFMRAEDKDSKDKEICDWFHICGVAPRLVLPDPKSEKNECPFVIYTLDPQEAFVVYHSGIGKRPLAGVIIQYDEEGKEYYCVYSQNEYFEVKGEKVTKADAHKLNGIPLVEYLNNESRMGAFEIVLPSLNAINVLESNRVDDIEQFVQSIVVFENCEINKETAEQLTEQLGLMISSDPSKPAKVYRVDGELSQSGVQTAKDDLYDSILTICGMPNRNGGSSTSDTGAAVAMRDGWSSAESRASDTEKMFNRADKQFLKIVLQICKETGVLNLRLADIKQEHTRNNLSNMQSRMQVLCEGLNNPKIHPKFPWLISGMPNSEEWYRVSQEWYEEQQRKQAKKELEAKGREADTNTTSERTEEKQTQNNELEKAD